MALRRGTQQRSKKGVQTAVGKGGKKMEVSVRADPQGLNHEAPQRFQVRGNQIPSRAFCQVDITMRQRKSKPEFIAHQ